MKRPLFLLLMCLLASVSFAGSPVNFGLNFQLVMPRASLETTEWDAVWDDFTSSSTSELANIEGISDLGYAGGIFLRFNGKGKGFLHSEAMFSFNSSGFTAFDETTQEEINFSTESTTFKVPIYLGRNLINTNAFKIRAFTGPQFTWLMTASANGTNIDDADADFDLDDFTWLWSLGAGIEIFMFSIDARYGFDLKGIEGANDLEQSFNKKTNLVEFTLGFKFF